MAAWPPPRIAAMPIPAGTLSTAAVTAATAPRRSPRPIPACRIGTRSPAANISIAKPTTARNAVVCSAESTQPKPVFPTSTPAASSPTTTGTSPPRVEGQERPAETRARDHREDAEAHRCNIVQPRVEKTGLPSSEASTATPSPGPVGAEPNPASDRGR